MDVYFNIQISTYLSVPLFTCWVKLRLSFPLMIIIIRLIIGALFLSLICALIWLMLPVYQHLNYHGSMRWRGKGLNIAIVCTCPMFLLFAQNIDHYINGLVLEHLCPISTLISTASYETIKWTLWNLIIWIFKLVRFPMMKLRNGKALFMAALDEVIIRSNSYNRLYISYHLILQCNGR